MSTKTTAELAIIFQKQADDIVRMNKIGETYYPRLEFKYMDLGGLEYDNADYGYIAG